MFFNLPLPCQLKIMYQTLTVYHSLLRWLVLLSLILSLITACTGLWKQRNFSKTDNAIRHWTATIAHIQLIAGILLYAQSPVTRFFREHNAEARQQFDITFFSVVHAILMLIAIILIAIGSSLSKRQNSDRDKFRTMALWYAIALLIIFIAIPWPFSPFATRPYIR
jgi:cytochrome bd-type quinol oxidase subunit 2